MINWIKKITTLIAFSIFFIVFFCGIDLHDPFNEHTLLMALLKGGSGAVIFWFATFIIRDIILKGVVEDIPESELDELEGGLIQRILNAKKEDTIIDKYYENREEVKKEKIEAIKNKDKNEE